MTQQPMMLTPDVPEPEAGTAYERLLSLLNRADARYRVIEHAPEGRTEVVSAYRGHLVLRGISSFT